MEEEDDDDEWRPQQCVCLFVRRQFRGLFDAAEPARTVGQFHILMDRRNRAGQIVRPGRQNSQGEETDRSFGLAVITFFYIIYLSDGHTEGLQNRPRRLTGQNVRTQKINKFLYLHAGPVLPVN
jgi:hypothetical protein